MMHFDSACQICGGTVFRALRDRSDGIPVLACERCGHGVVEHFRDDVAALYEDTYYLSDQPSEIGYSDYDYTAEQGVAWAAELVRLLVPQGRILDIGCGDGKLLAKIGPGYERFGIEVNHRMAERARQVGVHVIGSDLLEEQLQHKYAGSFDMVTAIAVFEHIVDFRAAVEAAIDLLSPHGLLLFEIPVISTNPNSDTWFKSSLEHLHYPSEQSVQYLFEETLRLPLEGAELDIRNFASVFIGLSAANPDVLKRAAELFRQVLAAPADHIFANTALARWLLHFIHAADSDPESICLAYLVRPEDLTPQLLRRVFDLWSVEKGREHAMREDLGATVRRQEEQIEELKLSRENLGATVRRQQEQIQELKLLREDLGATVRRQEWQIQEFQLSRGHLSATLERREKQIEVLTLQMEHMDALAATNERQTIELKHLKESWSWTITGPFRWAWRCTFGILR
jgi:SAM-dependent methyltransferase